MALSLIQETCDQFEVLVRHESITSYYLWLKDILWKQKFPLSFQLFALSHFNYLHQEQFHLQPWASHLALSVCRYSLPQRTAEHVGSGGWKEKSVFFPAKGKIWDWEKDDIPAFMAGEFCYKRISSQSCAAKLCSLIPLQFIKSLCRKDKAQILPKN